MTNETPVTARKRVAVGSRTSPLSLAQTEEILGPLRALHPDKDFVIVPIATEGDRRKDAPLLSMARGMFTKQIEVSLIDGEIDFAVHSTKDLPATLPDGLTLAAFGERQDPRDVLADRWGLPLRELPLGARLGTSSPRRTAQLKAIRSDLEILPIRGNVGTRLDKAGGVDYDGVVLAAAGLARLGRLDEVSEYLSPDVFTPEAGQGSLAVEARSSDVEMLAMLATIDHKPTNAEVTSERAFVQTIGGGCKVPVAVHAQIDGSLLRIAAMAALPDGSRVFRVKVTADASDPASAGSKAATALLETGAQEIVARGADQ